MAEIKVVNKNEREALYEFLIHVYLDILSVRELYDHDEKCSELLDGAKANIYQVMEAISIDKDASDKISEIVELIKSGKNNFEISRIADVQTSTIDRVRNHRT